MLKLSNGYAFSVACASGAFGFLNGWWWEKPLHWFSLINERFKTNTCTRLFRPEDWTIFIKSLSLEPIKGNLRIWNPFNLYRNCVQSFDFTHDFEDTTLKYDIKVDHSRETGTVNAVGLTNPGLPKWISKYYPYVKGLKLNVILSVVAKTVEEGQQIGKLLRPLKSIRGFELNWSCPNVSHDYDADLAVKVFRAIKAECDHPGGIKLGYEDPYLDIARELQQNSEWTTLINTIKWTTLYPNLRSPLAPWGLVGGVSGNRIAPYAREALIRYSQSRIKTPAISCGGINQVDDIYGRLVTGARAVQIGTMIKDNPMGAQRLFDEVTTTLKK